MYANNKKTSKTIGIAVCVFLGSVLLGYYCGKVIIPFSCWLFHGLVSYEQVFPFICLAIIACGLIHTIYCKKKGKSNPLLMWIIIALGIALGGIWLIYNEGNWFFSYKQGYSIIANDRGTGFVKLIKKEKTGKIGLINKWGTKVVPVTCDYICLYKDDVQEDDAFIGLILKNDSLRIYSFVDGKGRYCETTSLDTRDNIKLYVESKYGTIKQEFIGDTLFHQFVVLEHSQDKRENKESKDITDGYTEVCKVGIFFYSDYDSKIHYCMDLTMYVKNIGGTNVYFVEDGEMKTVSEVHNSFPNISFNAQYNLSSGSLRYFNNPAWSNSPSSDNINSQNHSDEPQKVVVEHQRSLQPINVWHQCYGCNGSGQCSLCGGLGWTYSSHSYDGRSQCLSCGGNGRCTSCAGQGGHYEVEYR